MGSKITDGRFPAPVGDDADGSGAGGSPVHPASPHDGRLASVAEIDRWLSIAEKGDLFVYAVQPYLPVGAAGARYMYTLRFQGLVTLTQKRSDLLKGEFAYRAQRTGAPLPEPEAEPEPRARLRLATPTFDVDEAAAIDTLLPLLKRAARHGRPCPTDAQLADRSGLPRAAIAGILAAMRAACLIKIDGVAAPTLRLITILATGHRTGFVKP